MQQNLVQDVAKHVAAIALPGGSQVIASQLAGTDVTDQYLGTVGQAVQVGSVYIVPISAGLTASDTLAVTFTINKQTAGGGDVAIATIQTKTTGGGGSGSWTKWVPIACTVPAGTTLAALDTLFVSTTHLSTGTATPSFQVLIFPPLS